MRWIIYDHPEGAAFLLGYDRVLHVKVRDSQHKPSAGSVDVKLVVACVDRIVWLPIECQRASDPRMALRMSRTLALAHVDAVVLARDLGGGRAVQIDPVELRTVQAARAACQPRTMPYAIHGVSPTYRVSNVLVRDNLRARALRGPDAACLRALYRWAEHEDLCALASELLASDMRPIRRTFRLGLLNWVSRARFGREVVDMTLQRQLEAAATAVREEYAPPDLLTQIQQEVREEKARLEALRARATRAEERMRAEARRAAHADQLTAQADQRAQEEARRAQAEALRAAQADQRARALVLRTAALLGATEDEVAALAKISDTDELDDAITKLAERRGGT